MLSVNGRAVPWRPGLTVSGLFGVEGYRLKTPPVHVTVNGGKVSKALWDTCVLPDGAEVKIVSFLQGG